MSDRITPEDVSKIKKYFNLDLKEVDAEKLKDLQKEARKKYHPDNFSHLDDEVIMDMAKERFQDIERLTHKLAGYLKAGIDLEEAMKAQPPKDWKVKEKYASEGMKIDIMTRDKALKYMLFNSRIIYRGDKMIIPGTNAKIFALEDYSGASSTGFRENIKILLTFGPDDDIKDIVHWLFRHISGRTSSFVIEGKVVKIDPYEIMKAIQKESVLQ